MLKKWREEFDDILRELEEDDRGSSTRPKLFGSAPVSSIREVYDDDSDLLIGTIRISRNGTGENMNTDTIDWENNQKNERENESKPIGDPTIWWTIGCMYTRNSEWQ